MSKPTQNRPKTPKIEVLSRASGKNHENINSGCYLLYLRHIRHSPKTQFFIMLGVQIWPRRLPGAGFKKTLNNCRKRDPGGPPDRIKFDERSPFPPVGSLRAPISASRGVLEGGIPKIDPKTTERIVQNYKKSC